ncbi:hypothetical protein [Thalassospira xiamenensis]|uniref:Uncharacterized protein n=1 Tax=Thalassospira xiamenensis TaxID=220697 RepID=A0A367X8W7_9PROT|nr:hypothetical protein [Thalassospira xiamenensis]KZB56387.1 hypothetical protein AUP41_14920 [Thalassospira xiamenensis]MCK2167163.1 hypothetical protein [Thalassospira xiamenensis]RCK50027.1 hypothetical protein TH44_12240 [Thalassospira xiamenensis]
MAMKLNKIISCPANDNGKAKNADIDVHICTISRAVGYHLARKHYLAWEKKQRRAVNDNNPATLGEEIKGQGPNE